MKSPLEWKALDLLQTSHLAKQRMLPTSCLPLLNSLKSHSPVLALKTVCHPHWVTASLSSPLKTPPKQLLAANETASALTSKPMSNRLRNPSLLLLSNQEHRSVNLRSQPRRRQNCSRKLKHLSSRRCWPEVRTDLSPSHSKWTQRPLLPSSSRSFPSGSQLLRSSDHSDPAAISPTSCQQSRRAN